VSNCSPLSEVTRTASGSGPFVSQLYGGLYIEVVDQLAVVDRWILSAFVRCGPSSTLRDGGVKERRRLDEQIDDVE